MKDESSFGGVFTIEHVRDGKVINTEKVHNLVVDEGLQHILNVVLDSTTSKKNTWYVGLFENDYTPLSTDTGATFCGAGKAGAFTDYDEAVRQTYTEAAATATPVTVTNSANKATFTISATATLYGAFLISASAKDASGDASSTLLAAARFTSSRAVVDDDQLLITYEFVASDA